MTVSLAMIVRNEERLIERALRSAMPACDELIVVDTGSTDRTPEIAQQLGAKIGDPVIHRVAAHQLELSVHLRSDGSLQRRLDIAHQQILRAAVRLRQFGIEIGEDVQLRDERLAVVHIVRVNAGPEERPARDALEAGQIDAARGEQIVVFLLEVVAHHRDDSGLCEKTRRKRDVRPRASEHPVDFPVWSLHTVVCDRSNHHHGHSFDCTCTHEKSTRSNRVTIP